jgi:hypothetical protein
VVEVSTQRVLYRFLSSVSTGFGHLALLTFSEISTLGTDLRSARVTALRRFASVYARRVEGEGVGLFQALAVLAADSFPPVFCFCVGGGLPLHVRRNVGASAD